LAMDHSYRTFVRSAVSTKPGQVHYALLMPKEARLLAYALLAPAETLEPK
jgi:hypothetical protein